MKPPVIAFFNNKSGVGKTSITYHLAWMYASKGLSVVAADLDPQANLTAMFLDDDRLEALWPDGLHASTVYGSIQPLHEGEGGLGDAHVENIHDNLGLVLGDLALSRFEDALSGAWPKASDRDPLSYRLLSAFWRVLMSAAEKRNANIVLVDVGPNLGAINRSALLAADYVVVPLVPDLFSLQGLRNLGPTLRDWRMGWDERLEKSPLKNLDLPTGKMKPAGYVVLQHAVRLSRPVKAYDRWAKRIPAEYRKYVLETNGDAPELPENDDCCLGMIKHYHSLIPMAQEARKPLFDLRSADGAIGAHLAAVHAARDDFDHLADAIWTRLGNDPLPRPSL